MATQRRSRPGLPLWLQSWPRRSSNGELAYPDVSLSDALSQHYVTELNRILTDTEVQSCIASAAYLIKPAQQDALKSALVDACWFFREVPPGVSTGPSRTERIRDIDQATRCAHRLIEYLSALPPELNVGTDIGYLLLRHESGNPKAFRTSSRRREIALAKQSKKPSVVDALHSLIGDLQEQSDQLRRSISFSRQERGSKSQHHPQIDFLLESIRAIKRARLGAGEFLLVARIVTILFDLDPALDPELVRARHTRNIARKTRA